MKKIITFEKELNFPSMIGEISSISLDQNVKFINQNQATGSLIVSGKYKMTEASTIIDDFKYELPVEINLTESIDIDSGKISINDFNYEVVNDDVLKCNIELLVEGIESIDLNDDVEILEEELVRECDGDNEEKEQEIPNFIDAEKEEKEEFKIEETVEKEEIEEKNDKEDNSIKVSSLFQAFENSEETFKTYSVYIMRKEDTLEKVLDKYKVSIDDIEEYNDISNIEVGSKIVIPSANE